MSRSESLTKLKPVSKSDYRFLYDLLKERNPRANISHKKMPTYRQHVSFVSSKPYSKWYVVLYDDSRVGSLYLSKQNEIGISFVDSSSHDQLGNHALQLLIKKNPRKRYLANVSPLNKKLQNFFVHNGFTQLEYTYELISDR